MTFTDLEPAAQRMTDLIRAVPDDVLTAPTPCLAYTFGDLLDHVDGVALAFTAAATKTTLGAAGQPPAGDASRLGADWRTRIPQRLATLTDAGRDPAARGGMTSAGGVEMPGDVAAIVALEELVIHGWDVARATDQPYDCDEPTLEVVRGLVAQFAGPDQAELRGEAYGDPVVVDDAAPLLDRVIGLSGRDPSWSARPR
ncbi:MAG: TIGR03086 family metal-binding protein [Acidimicrobiales bacterium]